MGRGEGKRREDGEIDFLDLKEFYDRVVNVKKESNTDHTKQK